MSCTQNTSARPPSTPGACARRGLRRAAGGLALGLWIAAAGTANAASLRFFGHGGSPDDGFVFPDRVSIDIEPQVPADVGATDFTVEFWLRGLLADNPNPAVTCGYGVAWVNGNIIIDRDRFNQGRKWGISLMAGRVAFGVSNEVLDYTLCGTRLVLDGAWHHVAVQRRLADGRMWIWVDGQLDAQGPMPPEAGPQGDVSYPDALPPGEYCSPDGGSGNLTCLSDYTLVFGAEKHGFSGICYSGWLDEVRLSTQLRYAAPFVRPNAPFTNDAATAALYHFDEGIGEEVADAATATGGPSTGRIQYGGAAPAGPVWSGDSPFNASTAAPLAAAWNGLRLLPASPSPFRDVTVVAFELPRAMAASVRVMDVRGRLVRTLLRRDDQLAAGRHELPWDGRDAGGRPVVPGTYLVRVETDAASQSKAIVKLR